MNTERQFVRTELERRLQEVWDEPDETESQNLMLQVGVDIVLGLSDLAVEQGVGFFV